MVIFIWLCSLLTYPTMTSLREINQFGENPEKSRHGIHQPPLRQTVPTWQSTTSLCIRSGFFLGICQGIYSFLNSQDSEKSMKVVNTYYKSPLNEKLIDTFLVGRNPLTSSRNPAGEADRERQVKEDISGKPSGHSVICSFCNGCHVCQWVSPVLSAANGESHLQIKCILISLYTEDALWKSCE